LCKNTNLSKHIDNRELNPYNEDRKRQTKTMRKDNTMTNFNNGYIGRSRSVRSQRAIDSYEVPLSMINKSLIEEYLDEIEVAEELSADDINYLRALTISRWKFGAKRNGAASWHHTSKFYNETLHYSLDEIADYILNDREWFEEAYLKEVEKNRPTAEQLQVRAEKRAKKELEAERALLFPYQMKYKTLRGFLNGKVDYDKLAEVRKNAIETKRAELIEQWTKFNLDPSHDNWEWVKSDKFVENRIDRRRK
jgi:hypothetical protein